MALHDYGHKLFIGALPDDIQKAELETVFGTYGTVTHVHIMDAHPKTGLRCAFVYYSTKESGEDAIQVLNGVYKIREDAQEPIRVRWGEESGAKRPRRDWGSKGGFDAGGKDWGKGGGDRSGMDWGKGDWHQGDCQRHRGRDEWASGGGFGGGGGGSFGGGGGGSSGGREQERNKGEIKLFVGNLPPDITEEELRIVFSTYGQVSHVHINNQAGKVTGMRCAFVFYHEKEAAEDAIKVLHGIYRIREGGEKIDVKWGRPSERTNGGNNRQDWGGYGGGWSDGGGKGCGGQGWQASGWQDCGGWQGGGGKGGCGGGWQDSGTGWQDQNNNWNSSGWDDRSGGGMAGRVSGFGCQGANAAGTQLHVSNLPSDITPDAMKYVFNTYGTVRDLRITLDELGRSDRAAAVVEYTSSDDAETAISSLHGKYEIRQGYGPIVVTSANKRTSPY